MRRPMRRLMALSTFALVSLSSIASAAETCAYAKQRCIDILKFRGEYVANGQSKCDVAFPVCMRTGVWDTKSFRFGIRIQGMVKSAKLASYEMDPPGPGPDAMRQCQTYYGGNRFWLNRDRYAYIEECVRQKTGFTPTQLHLNCKVWMC
jgi:hypothetical protein